MNIENFINELKQSYDPYKMLEYPRKIAKDKAALTYGIGSPFYTHEWNSLMKRYIEQIAIYWASDLYKMGVISEDEAKQFIDSTIKRLENMNGHVLGMNFTEFNNKGVKH